MNDLLRNKIVDKDRELNVNIFIITPYSPLPFSKDNK